MVTTPSRGLPLTVDRIEAPTPGALLQSASQRLRIHLSRPMSPYEMDIAHHIHGITLIDASSFDWEHRLLVDDDQNAAAIHTALGHIQTQGAQRQSACETASQHLESRARTIQQRLDTMTGQDPTPT